MKRIWMVHDAEAVRPFYRFVPTATGYMMEEAVDGAEALEKAAGDRRDLYRVEMDIPQMDKHPVLHVLQQRSGDQTPPIIRSTESGETAHPQVLREGAHVYQPKLVRPDMLAQPVPRLLGEMPV